ncbi:MAG TPA: TonB-dependent receptor [Terriglobales bacterium]|nr:TonB-dependent receptor [Terriglobales bacterium]
MRSYFRLLRAVVLIFLCNCTVAASATSWSGALRDAVGNPVAGATIVLADASGKHVFTITTTPTGEFVFFNLTSSKYAISIAIAGNNFKSIGTIEVKDDVRLTSALQLSSPDKGLVFVQEQNTATAQASGGERLSGAEVSSLPLNSRDFSKLLLLAAGTMTDANGAANFTQQFAVNGQRGSTTVFAMDGADTTDPEMGGATFSNFNVDAIQEVESSSGVMLPEIGHGAAGYTNVVTRSGTDSIHGSMFEFFRNASLDARNYFDHVSLDHRRIPPFIRNEFGGAIGGPLVLPVYDGRNSTFFFGEYQGFRQILGTTQVFPVPTEAERNGTVNVCFPNANGSCDPDRLTIPVANSIKPVLNAYPLPNDPAGPYGARTFATSSKVTTVTDQFSVRMDHRISDKAQLFTRFSLNQVTGPLTNPDQTAIDPSFAIKFFDHQRNAGLSYSRTISSHLSFQTSLGYIRSTPFFPASNHTQPAILFGDGLLSAYGAPAGSIYGSYSNLYQLKHDMTDIHGAHTFKWGVEIRVNRDSTIFGTAPNGAYSFGGGTAYYAADNPQAPPIISASGTHNINPGDPLPDSLTGLLTATPYSYNIVAPAEFTPTGSKFNEAGVRREAYNFYFQDAWKATPRLTISYGLRYEINTRIHEETKRTSLPFFYDVNGKPTSYWNHQATYQLVVNPQPPYDKDWNGWGPRLAIDYAVTPHTVFHAGAALTTRLMNLWQENSLTAAIPFVFNPFFTSQPNTAVPFTDAVVPLTLPPSYDTNGNLIFPNNRSTDAKPNTVMDVARFQKDVADLTPGHQTQLPAIYGIAKNFRNGMIGSWTLGVDHDFRDFKASAAYVATTGIHLPEPFFPNSYTGADPAFAPFTTFDQAGNRTGGAGQISLITSDSHSSYHALQASVAKNSPRAGLGLQASYTYSKSIDDTSSVIGGSIAGAGVVLQTPPQDPWNPRAEKGASTFDVTHVFTVSWIQLLPFERVSFLRPMGKTLTSGWQFLNITTLMTGSPFTVYSGVQQTGAGAGGTDRPDLVAMPHFSTSGPVRADYFGRGADNASFFNIPINLPDGTGPNHGRFGTLGRSTFRGPGFHNFDVALIKDTPFGRRDNAQFGTLEFRAEFFNVFNVVNFGLPSNVVRGSGFGLISKTAGSSRQIQFSVKVMF